MGFWDVAKSVGQMAVDGARDKNDSIRMWYDRYQDYDDDKLIKMFKSGSLSGDRKLAVMQLLKERGY